MTKHWQLEHPIDAITFDCDSTLSAIEGIDELAKCNGVAAAVQHMTDLAMNETGLNAQLYANRLALVKPTHTQVKHLGEQYYLQRSLDAVEIIQCLHRLNKAIYILSAGIQQSLQIFAKKLGIPDQNVFGVNLYFDNQGHYEGFDHQSPLVTQAGKKIIASEITKKYPGIIHIGDGLNDFSIHEIAIRFIGYGGFAYREKVAQFSDFYLRNESMAAMLPLCLTAAEVKKLNPTEQQLYQKGITLLGIDQSLNI